MTPIQKLQLNKAVEKVLHAPCNIKKENREWTFVFDYNLSKDEISVISKEVVTTLKQNHPFFQNARLNVLEWISDSEMNHKIVPMPLIQIGSYFKEYKMQPNEKRIEELAMQLKLFQARSKLIILLSDGSYHLEDLIKWKQSINPFLGKKMLLIHEHTCKFLTKERWQ